MNNQEKQELNEKIARFSGIRYISYEVRYGGPPTPRTGYYWNGEYIGKESPDFLDPINGLGLMFKYPVPLIIEDTPSTEIKIIILAPDQVACYIDETIYSTADNPTTVLAIALGKLIDSINNTYITLQ